MTAVPREVVDADVAADTGWTYAATARPMRGLHDYERRITFGRPLTNDEVCALREWLRAHQPGYCGFSVEHDGAGGVWATSTMDSSD